MRSPPHNITDYRGELYERIEYTPHGETWIEHKYPGYSNTEIPYRFTGKEQDEETGLYYYGARYLDSKASRWLSADPAVGEYIPEAPVNEEARERNGKLPGMGGIYNVINMHLYHYAGNNPVKYTDPDGREDNDFSTPTLSQGDPKKFEKPWYGKIPIISNLLSGTYFFYRNTIKGEGYQDIAYDPITHEMAMPKDQRMLAFGAFMTVASSALFGGLEAGAQKAGEVINKTFADLGSLKGKNMAEAKQLLESNGFRYLSTSKGGYTTFAGPGTGSTRLTVTIRPNGQVISDQPLVV